MHKDYTSNYWKAASDADADELDLALVERRFVLRMSDMTLAGGFCAQCQHLLENWPAGEDSEKLDDGSA
jgi:hypothetical protein